MRKSLRQYRKILRELYVHQRMVCRALDMLTEEVGKAGDIDPDILTDEKQAVIDSRTKATLENIELIQDTLRKRCEENKAYMIMAEVELRKTPDEILNELKATEEN